MELMHTPAVSPAWTPAPGNPRTQDLLEAFIASQDVRHSSKGLYKRTLRLFFAWVERQGYELRDVARPHLIEYKEQLLKAGLSTLSVGSYISSVRLFYEWTEANRYYPNVARGIRAPRRVQEIRKLPLSPSQAAELLAHVERTQNARDYAIVNLLIRTGLRTIELARADVEDIRQLNGHRVLMIQGKGMSSKDSYVKLTDKSYAPIARYLSGQTLAPGTPIFRSCSNNSKGERMTTRTVSGIVKDALRAIGLNDRAFTAHSLRHTAVVNCRRAGGTPEQAQMMARHASPVTTQIYDRYFRMEERLAHSGEDLIDTLY
jgi:integrase/recombinase XerD